MAGPDQKRRWLAAEVVQTSAMDCGPAALKCLLEGFSIPVSYGRLREACQTDVDGTSIDTIELVANQLGLRAEQKMLPKDHLFLEDVPFEPLLVVVRHADGPTHFVVAWRKVGGFVQIMDPAVGRRWVRVGAFREEIYKHETSVDAADWRDWAASAEFLDALRGRLKLIGVRDETANQLISAAETDAGWFGFGALDACVRLCGLVISAGGSQDREESGRIVSALFNETRAQAGDPFRVVPSEYWAVRPSPDTAQSEHLLLRGAVLVRVTGRRTSEREAEEPAEYTQEKLSPELAAALSERPQNPLVILWGMLKSDGILGLAALAGAIAIATGASVLEALLFRGIFELGSMLALPSQRLVASAGLITFACLLLAMRAPIVVESLRTGRRFDVVLRMALLRKLPHLTDRYFQSRPISDMADRSHNIHLVRSVPGLGIAFVQTVFEVFLTFAGLMIIAPETIIPALLLIIVSLSIPAIVQPIVNERDLRVRNHAATLNGFYLDTLLGLVPVRTHRAQRAIRHQHESMLVEWARSSYRLIRTSVAANAVQALATTAVASYLLVAHFSTGKAVTGADLLLIYWVLKLPGLATAITQLAHQYPAQRNILLRLMEPLAAPEALPRNLPPVQIEPMHAASSSSHAVAVHIVDGTVLAAGRPILKDINLEIRAGEHVAIVGLSGAGKSSLLGLLLGWHRLAEGYIAVEGKELTPERNVTLRRDIAWLDPAVQIWNETLLYNLKYSSDDSGYTRISAAIQKSGLRDVVKKLNNGMQTELGEGGALLSGGEGQRVRFARALAQKNVRLALLDEPFRGMDRGQRSKMLIQAKEHWHDSTLLCVTHDVSETLDFDRVLVVENGTILEDAAPASLAASASRYRELLDIEQEVHAHMWAGVQWRRMRIEHGQIVQGQP